MSEKYSYLYRNTTTENINIWTDCMIILKID